MCNMEVLDEQTLHSRRSKNGPAFFFFFFLQYGSIKNKPGTCVQILVNLDLCVLNPQEGSSKPES
jgi:hypothetical protein